MLISFTHCINKLALNILCTSDHVAPTGAGPLHLSMAARRWSGSPERFLNLVWCVEQVARAMILAYSSVRASRSLHARLLEKLMRLPMSFFDSQPTGESSAMTRLVILKKSSQTLTLHLCMLSGSWAGHMHSHSCASPMLPVTLLSPASTASSCIKGHCMVICADQ